MWQDQTWRTSMKARANPRASASPLPDIGRGRLVDLAIFEHSVFQLEGTWKMGLYGWFNKLYWHTFPTIPLHGCLSWQPKHWVALSFTPARSTLPAGSRRYLQLKGFATFQVRLLNVRVYPATLGTLVKPCPYLEFTPSMNLHQYCKSPATVLKDMLSTPNFPVWKAMPCRVDQSGKQHLPKRKNACARFGKRQPYFWCKTKFKAG